MDLFNCTLLFHSVVEHGTMSKAGQQLGLSPSVVTKRIAWLEDKLGVQLLMRTTRQLALTEAGSLFYKQSLQLSHQWQSLLDETAGSGQLSKGKLRIAAPQPLTNRILVQCCKEFQQLYPNIEIELEVAHYQDLPLSHADISFCAELAGFNSCSYIGQKIFDMHYQLYASPEYIQRHDPITNFKQISDHNCLYFGLENKASWRLGEDSITVEGTMKTNNTEVLVTAATLGQGIAYLPSELVHDEVDKGLLEPILSELKGDSTPTYIYFPKLDHMPQKVRLFVDFFKNSFQ